jgi:hypothetical protein
LTKEEIVGIVRVDEGDCAAGDEVEDARLEVAVEDLGSAVKLTRREGEGGRREVKSGYSARGEGAERNQEQVIKRKHRRENRQEKRWCVDAGMSGRRQV